MNVWIVSHPFFENSQQGKSLREMVRQEAGVEPQWYTRRKDINYLYEDIAPHPDKYPDLVIWSGRVGSRVSFDAGGYMDRVYAGDGKVDMKWAMKYHVPAAKPRFVKFTEGGAGFFTKLRIQQQIRRLLKTA